MNKRKLWVFILCILALVGIFTILAGLKAIVIQTTKKYPASIHCGRFNIDAKFLDQYKKYATIDKPATENFQGLGYYYCYCKSNSKLTDLTKPEHFCYDYQFD